MIRSQLEGCGIDTDVYLKDARTLRPLRGWGGLKLSTMQEGASPSDVNNRLRNLAIWRTDRQRERERRLDCFLLDCGV